MRYESTQFGLTLLKDYILLLNSNYFKHSPLELVTWLFCSFIIKQLCISLSLRINPTFCFIIKLPTWDDEGKVQHNDIDIHKKIQNRKWCTTITRCSSIVALIPRMQIVLKSHIYLFECSWHTRVCVFLFKWLQWTPWKMNLPISEIGNALYTTRQFNVSECYGYYIGKILYSVTCRM